MKHLQKLRVHGFRIIYGYNAGNSGYNPPDFVLNAAKECLDRVDCNQCAPTKVIIRSGGYVYHYN